MVTLILYDFLLIWTKNLGQTAQNIGGAESAPPRTIRRPKSPDFLGLIETVRLGVRALGGIQNQYSK